MSVKGNWSGSRNSKSVKNSRKLSARMDSEVVDAFKLFDRDKDGRVTRDEIVDLIESLDGDSSCPHVQVIATNKNLSKRCLKYKLLQERMCPIILF